MFLHVIISHSIISRGVPLPLLHLIFRVVMMFSSTYLLIVWPKNDVGLSMIKRREMTGNGFARFLRDITRIFLQVTFSSCCHFKLKSPNETCLSSPSICMLQYFFSLLLLMPCSTNIDYPPVPSTSSLRDVPFQSIFFTQFICPLCLQFVYALYMCSIYWFCKSACYPWFVCICQDFLHITQKNSNFSPPLTQISCIHYLAVWDVALASAVLYFRSLIL